MLTTFKFSVIHTKVGREGRKKNNQDYTQLAISISYRTYNLLQANMHLYYSWVRILLKLVIVVYQYYTYLNMQFWVRVHVIKKLLVVGVLLVPLYSFIIAEIVSQWYQQNFATEKLRLLAILVQKGLNPDIQKEANK